ncbi:MAG: TIGR03749 family integrating conjugative element protein [Salinisphaera sp.]|nr:TIGR03749 family integrating conjugative element protein [Salinisphaera sp.]
MNLWTRPLACGLAGLVLLAATGADATQIRHWKRTPIQVNLPVGTERIVVFGDDVRVGLPSAIADPEQLRVQSTGGAVYFEAHKAFVTQRVQVQDIATGRMILLDLTAKPHASHETVKVVQGASDTNNAGSGSDAAPAHANIPPAAFAPSAQSAQSAQSAPTAVRLVRHAAQALYAPERLVSGAPGVRRVALATQHPLPGLLPTLPVIVTPLAAWRGGSFIVTALQITNQDPRRAFTLDPRALEGHFYAASFMQSTIGPAGSLTDTTTLFAVTRDGDLADALTGPYGDQATAREADDAH